MRSVDVVVRGRVQGVFFRASTQERARELGVRGTVRNRLDGTVLIEAEAEEETLARFLAWVRTGPPASRVDESVVEESPVRGFAGFEVLR
jgi:acylphosphatase